MVQERYHDILYEKIFDGNFYSWDSRAIRDFITERNSNLTPKQVCDLFIDKTKYLLRSYGKDDIIKKNLKFFITSELHNLASNPNFRDHIIHAINVYLLGHYIINSNQTFWEDNNIEITENVDSFFYIADNTLRKQPCLVQDSDKMKVFNFSWLVAAILHDFGYISENMKNAIKQLNDIKKQFPFLVYKLKFQPKLKEEKYNSALLLLKDFFKQINIDEEWNEFDFSRFFKIDEKNYIINHGISSSITYLNNMINKERARNIRNSRVYWNYINWGANRSIALAMALHDLPKLKRFAKKEKMDNYEMIIAYKIKFTKDPLTVLLILCDSLQDWDRERVLEGFQNDDVQKVKLKRIDCYSNQSKIILDIEIEYYLQETELRQNLDEDEVKILLDTKILKIKRNKLDILNHIDLENLIEVKFNYEVKFRDKIKENSIQLQ